MSEPVEYPQPSGPFDLIKPTYDKYAPPNSPPFEANDYAAHEAACNAYFDDVYGPVGD